VRKIITGIILLCLLSCATLNEPVIIEQIPKADLSEDMTIEEYIKTSTKLNIDLKTYIDNLILQIKSKIKNIIDLRGDENGK
jgi:hypothetical protein